MLLTDKIFVSAASSILFRFYKLVQKDSDSVKSERLYSQIRKILSMSVAIGFFVYIHYEIRKFICNSIQFL